MATKRYDRYENIYEIPVLLSSEGGLCKPSTVCLELTPKGLVEPMTGIKVGWPKDGPTLRGWGNLDCEKSVKIKTEHSLRYLSYNIGRRGWEAAVADMKKRKPEWAEAANLNY